MGLVDGRGRWFPKGCPLVLRLTGVYSCLPPGPLRSNGPNPEALPGLHTAVLLQEPVSQTLKSRSRCDKQSTASHLELFPFENLMYMTQHLFIHIVEVSHTNVFPFLYISTSILFSAIHSEYFISFLSIYLYLVLPISIPLSSFLSFLVIPTGQQSEDLSPF